MRSDRSTDRAALFVAVGSILVWLALISIYQPHPIADEAGHHLRVIRQFYEGDWSLPAHLPMFPGYHAVAAIVCGVFGADLLVLRAFSAAMIIGAVLLLRAALRHRQAACPADSLLRFAWLPILFPFTVLAYTESASMLLLTVALYCHVRRYRRCSAVALLLACLVRQSNVVWAAMLGVLTVAEIVRRRQDTAKESAPHRNRYVFLIAQHIWPHVTVIALVGIWMLLPGGLELGQVEANRPRFNIAQFYLFALLVVLLWAPVVCGRLPDDVRSLRRWLTSTPAKAAMTTMLAMTAVAAMVAAFRNPHPWNHNEAYFRNGALILMSESWPARLIACCLILGAGVSIVHFTARQTNRGTLVVIWLLSLLYLLPHSLAEPRYYIVPVFFLNFFTDYRRPEARRLTLWYLLICAVVGTAVLWKGGPDGGVW